MVKDYYKDLKIVGANRIKDEIFLKANKKWWIKADAAMKYIDRDMYYSGSGKRVYIPIESLDLKLENRELTSYLIKHLDKINMPVRVIDGIKYLEIEQLENIYPVRHAYYDERGVHVLVNNEMGLKTGVTSESVAIMESQNSEGLEVGKLKKGELVNILRTDETDMLVVSQDGAFGYIPISSVSNPEKVDINNKPVRENQEKVMLERTRLVWEQIHDYKYFDGIMKYGPEEGLDVLSPTWFSLNVDGIVLNIADQAYVDAAHEKGLQVWALFSNSFDPDWTHEMLSSESLRAKVIGQICAYSAIYDLDGINIDFENVYMKDKADFSSFVAELSQMLHQQGQVVSIDVTVPWGSERYSLFADRVALASAVDYVMLMAYDEHWASIQSPGSVASRDWVERGIEKSLELIPREKLILGVPFYSRVWSQIGSGKVSSKAVGFNGQKVWLEKTGADVMYDPETGQNYAEALVDGVKQKIWLEDDVSLNMRIGLAKKYNLPGIAGWSLLFTTQEVWDQISDEYPVKGGKQ